jgi:hypothetical protein
MKAWKGLVFMWSMVGLIALFQFITTYPIAVGAWIHSNPQIFGVIISASITLPLTIWLIKFMGNTMGGGKDPKKFWDEDKDEF